jgi:hypothetical protein
MERRPDLWAAHVLTEEDRKLLVDETLSDIPFPASADSDAEFRRRAVRRLLAESGEDVASE